MLSPFLQEKGTVHYSTFCLRETVCAWGQQNVPQTLVPIVATKCDGQIRLLKRKITYYYYYYIGPMRLLFNVLAKISTKYCVLIRGNKTCHECLHILLPFGRQYMQGLQYVPRGAHIVASDKTCRGDKMWCNTGNNHQQLHYMFLHKISPWSCWVLETSVSFLGYIVVPYA